MNNTIKFNLSETIYEVYVKVKLRAIFYTLSGVMSYE